MAQFGVGNSVRVNAANVFPEGTEVSAYFRREIPVGHNGSPIGSPVATATVEDGILFFQNRPSPGVVTGDLVDGERYVAVAQVGGTWRYLGFSMDPQKTQGFREDSEPQTGSMLTAHNFAVGYNPSVDLWPNDTARWATLDFVIVTDRGGGNRTHVRALNLVGIDPPEAVFRGLGPDNTAPYGPNDDGTDLAAANEGRGLGRVAWQGLTPQERFAGWAAHIGVHAAEECREDVLNLTLANEITLPQDTIEIVGDLDAVASHADGTVMAWTQAGMARIGGQRVFYGSRSATKLFGCEGGTGTFPAGQNINQHQIANAGRMHFHTSALGTNDRANRIRLNEDGSTTIGEQAILESARDAFVLFQGGSFRVKAVRAPTDFTADVVGTSGTTSITYKLVGNTPDGKQIAPVSVTIATAPDQLDEDNYVKLSWQHSEAGVHSWDVIRESTDGLPADTGPIVHRRPAIAGRGSQGTRAADYGQAPTAVNERQQILVRNATGGRFRVNYEGGTSNFIDYDDTASEVQTALENIAALEDNISVTQGGTSNWVVEFTNALAGTNVSQLTPRLPLELENEPEDVEEPEEGEEPLEDFPAPSILIRTRTQGGPLSYVLPTRDSTGDATVDGQLTVSQMMKLPELSADPDAPSTNEALIYAKDNGGKTTIYARFNTGAIVSIAAQP